MSNEPKICVLIPAYNEAEVILGTIKALYIAGFSSTNIFVADDRSTDGTAKLIRNFADVFCVPKNGGKARAQVAAIEHFKLTDKFDWVVFLDGDTKVDSNFLTVVKDAIGKDPDVSLFVGQVTSAKNDHVFSASRAYEYTFFQEISKKGQNNFNVVFVAPGCASVYKSTMLKKLDIDPNTLAEDMDLTLQVHRHGGRVEYVHAARVITQDPCTLIDYTKQVSRWYRGFWQVIRKHKVFGLVKKKPVDFYMMFVAINALIFNRAFALIACAFLLTPKMFGIAMIGDFCVFAAIGIYCSIYTQRLDLLYKLPVYFWISYINLYAFLRGFVEVIVLRKDILVWNKVQRYNFDSLTTT